VRYAVIGDEKRVDPRIPSQMTSFFLGEGGGVGRGHCEGVSRINAKKRRTSLKTRTW